MYSKVSDADESILDFNEVLKVELKNDNVQLFKTRWDETAIAMKKQPDEAILDKSVLPSASTVRTAQAIAVSVHSRYCSKKVNRETFPDSKRGGPIFGAEKVVRSIVLLVKDNFVKLAYGAAWSQG